MKACDLFPEQCKSLSPFSEARHRHFFLKLEVAIARILSYLSIVSCSSPCPPFHCSDRFLARRFSLLTDRIEPPVPKSPFYCTDCHRQISKSSTLVFLTFSCNSTTARHKQISTLLDEIVALWYGGFSSTIMGMGAQVQAWEEVRKPSDEQMIAEKDQGKGSGAWSLLSSCAFCWPRKGNGKDTAEKPIPEEKLSSRGTPPKDSPKICTVPPVDQSFKSDVSCKSDATERSVMSKTEEELVASSQLRRFCFADLKMATRNFRPDSLLGKGGFGCVFKGWIDEHGTAPVKPGTGLTVAVKVLDNSGLQGHREWLAEITFLGQLHHPNLVKLIGFCMEDDQRLLVYEFMQRGSLENHLFQKGALPLPWNTRMKIALGAAKGVEFLHSGKKPVIYRDFKTSNVLLDLEYRARLSDFGLAKDGPEGDKTHVSTRVMGTQGYAAPEYVMTGHLSTKSDVYSFGIVLLEMMTGKKSMDKTRPYGEQHLAEWARTFLMDKKKILKIIDPRLEGSYSIKGAQKAGQLASCCIRRDFRLRPSMSEIVQALSQIQNLKDMANGTHASQQAGGDGPRLRLEKVTYQPKGS